jgi:hypothetical protein
MVEKAALVGKVFGKAKQQLYQQQYQLSLTLQFQLHARNADASNSLEATKNKVSQLMKNYTKRCGWTILCHRQLDNFALRG